jgi:hypothetical protein
MERGPVIGCRSPLRSPLVRRLPSTMEIVSSILATEMCWPKIVMGISQRVSVAVLATVLSCGARVGRASHGRHQLQPSPRGAASDLIV